MPKLDYKALKLKTLYPLPILYVKKKYPKPTQNSNEKLKTQNSNNTGYNRGGNALHVLFFIYLKIQYVSPFF